MLIHSVSDMSAKHLDGLIGDIAAGDRAALAELYKLTSGNVYSFALSILKNPCDAQDVLQDCYLRIFSAADSYSGKGKPLAWILTITRNLCLKQIRLANRSVQLPDGDWEQLPQSGFEHTVDDIVTLRACMQSLSDEERQIVVLHAVSGLKHREISDLLGKPLATVLSKYNRAIKKLRSILEKGAY